MQRIAIIFDNQAGRKPPAFTAAGRFKRPGEVETFSAKGSRAEYRASRSLPAASGSFTMARMTRSTRQRQPDPRVKPQTQKSNTLAFTFPNPRALHRRDGAWISPEGDQVHLFRICRTCAGSALSTSRIIPSIQRAGGAYERTGLFLVHRQCRPDAGRARPQVGARTCASCTKNWRAAGALVRPL